jgi:hypothetical protein
VDAESGPPVRWSPNAIAAVRAIRQATGAPFYAVFPRAIVASLARQPLPGESLIADGLRQPTIWSNAVTVIESDAENSQRYPPGSVGHIIYHIESAAADLARREGAHIVGERHLLRVLQPEQLWTMYGIDVPKLTELVNLGELGAGFDAESITDRWHGMVETSIIIQYDHIRSIPWLEELHRHNRHRDVRKATLWITGSVLNEVHFLSYSGDTNRVRTRAREFGKYVSENLDAMLSATGLALPSEGAVRLRLWAPSGMGGLRDTDHIEAAMALGDRGVRVHIITADIGLTGRARAARLMTFQPSDESALAPEPSPRDRELELRLRRANLEAPPGFDVQILVNAPARIGTLTLRIAESGGAARNAAISWKTRTYVPVDQIVPIQQRGDRYHQTLPPYLPPGATLSLAGLACNDTVIVDWEMWAEGAELESGCVTVTADSLSISSPPVHPQ